MYPPPPSACSPPAAARSNKLYTNANIPSLQNAPCDAVGDTVCLGLDRGPCGRGLVSQCLLFGCELSGSFRLCIGDQLRTAVDCGCALLLDQFVAFAAGRKHFLVEFCFFLDGIIEDLFRFAARAELVLVARGKYAIYRLEKRPVQDPDHYQDQRDVDE